MNSTMDLKQQYLNSGYVSRNQYARHPIDPIQNSLDNEVEAAIEALWKTYDHEVEVRRKVHAYEVEALRKTLASDVQSVLKEYQTNTYLEIVCI